MNTISCPFVGIFMIGRGVGIFRKFKIFYSCKKVNDGSVENTFGSYLLFIFVCSFLMFMSMSAFWPAAD